MDSSFLAAIFLALVVSADAHTAHLLLARLGTVRTPHRRLVIGWTITVLGKRRGSYAEVPAQLGRGDLPALNHPPCGSVGFAEVVRDLLKREQGFKRDRQGIRWGSPHCLRVWESLRSC